MRIEDRYVVKGIWRTCEEAHFDLIQTIQYVAGKYFLLNDLRHLYSHKNRLLMDKGTLVEGSSR